jgi:hypothetical protein
MEMNAFLRAYRDGLISQAGLCVFVCGLKAAPGAAPVIADGVMAEFESAKRLRRLLLPIGATGGAAKKIWDEVATDLARLCPHISRKDFALLNDPKQTPQALANIVGKVITAADKAPPIARKAVARPKRAR